MRLIDADDLLEIIEKYCGDYDCHDSESFDKQAVRMAIRSAPTITPPNEWVSVEERLPEEKQRVIVRCERVGTSVGWILWGNWMADIGPDAGKVTHWMPLPAPPSKDNNVLTKWQNKWISVGDAVPDPGDRVLATDGIFVGEAYRTSADSWYRHTGFPWRLACGKIVTHWMPLPVPPEKESEGR